MATVLIVEDEISIADTIRVALSAEGFVSEWLRLGEPAVERVRQGGLDFVVLDVGLPDLSGFEVCKAIRRVSEVPLLFLTARGAEVDRIVGLEIGADDYLVKPFSPRELATRVRVILKRSKKTGAGEETQPSRSDEPREEESPPEFVIDAARRTICFLGRELRLTALEHRLLELLVTEPGRVLSRSQLLRGLGFSMEANYERNIDSHIKSLRQKLREIEPSRDPIATRRGFGYSYEPQLPSRLTKDPRRDGADR